MQSGGKIMKEVSGQGYCIAVSRIWEKNDTTVGGMTQLENSYATIKKHKKN